MPVRPHPRSRIVRVAASLLVVATCRLDTLIRPPQGALLCVTPSVPDTLRDSAASGSSAPRVDSVGISNCGGGELRWTAFVKHGSAWLVVRPESGLVGQSAPPQAIFTPVGLDSGIHRETIVVSSASGNGAAEIPVWFYIHPCRVTPITIDNAATATLTAADCGAPHHPGRYARLYGFPGTADDSASIEIQARIPGGAAVLLDTSLDATQPPLAESADCLGAAGNPCLYYQRLPRSILYYVEVTSAANGDSGDFTLRLVHPRVPGLPDSLDQRLEDSVTRVAPGATIGQTSILLRAVVSDPDRGDSLHLEAEVRPVGVAFSGSNVPDGPAVANGEVAWLAVSGLSDKTSYHWRARAADPTGRSGPWAVFGGAPDFVVNVLHPPGTPTTLGQARIDGSGILTGATVDTNVVILSAVTADPDPGDLVRLEVEVRPVGVAFTGATDSSAAMVDGGPQQVSIGPLLGGTSYHWRARAVDQTGATSGWSSYGGNAETATDFAVAAAHAPDPPAALAQLQATDRSPIPVGGVAAASTVILTGVVSDSNPGQGVQLEVELEPLGQAFLGTANYASPLVASNTVAEATAGPLVVNTAYHWQARARNGAGGTSAWISFPIAHANPETEADFSYQGSLPPVQLVFTVQPSTAKAGKAIVPPVQVTAQDANGVTSIDFTGQVTITLQPNFYGGKLSGKTTVTAVGGVATFAGLSVSRPGIGYVLRATTSQPALTVLSAPFDITR